MQLRGRKALVTGAARRVGRALALALARRGADLVLHYHRSAAEARETAEEARRLGVQVALAQADLGTAAGVESLVQQARGAFGGVDVLVNNAAIYRRTPMDSLSLRDWEDHLRINLTAPFLCGLALGRHMVERGAGKIINVADAAADRPYPGFLPYFVSKAGLVGLTRALALELAPRVQVNAVAPGPVLNPEGMDRDEVEAIPMRTPLARMGAPEDVAAAVVFLAEGSDFVTGAVLPVDGGWLLRP